MEKTICLCHLGFTTHDYNRHYRHHIDRDDFLTASNGESKSTNYLIQPPTVVLPVACSEETTDMLLAHHHCALCVILRWCLFPVLRRGHLDFGIMFAFTEYTSFE